MIYIFEDDENDPISILYRQAYHEETLKNFRYTKGNGNVYKVAEYELKSTTENITVFIDMVPGNRDLIRIYNDLKRLSKAYKFRLMILPIVCSEYYLIKSLLETHLIIDNTGIDICVDRKGYFESAVIKTEEDRAFCKNFEKYCKLITKKNLHRCVSHSNDNNEQYNVYYTYHCKCSNIIEGCSTESLKDKSIKMLMQYPCFPIGTYKEHIRKLSQEEINCIHIKMVEDFNCMVNNYRDLDLSHRDKYKNIKPMQHAAL